MDKLNRTLLVDMRFSESDAPLLTIELTFPSMYPYQVAPAVAIIENDTDFDSFKIKEGTIGFPYVFRLDSKRFASRNHLIMRLVQPK